MSDKKPNIVVISASDVNPDTIIKMMANCAKINEVAEEKESIYSWNIDTKYYNADVNIRAITTDENNADLKDNVEAIVMHFDSDKDTGLDDLMKWQMFVNNHQPEIKILVADVFNENTKITKRHAIGWCLQNEFELIELNPSPKVEDEPTSEEDDEEIIKETKGVERVIEALETHMWSNLVMKSKVNLFDSVEKSPIDPTNTSNIDEMLNNLMLDDEELDFGGMFQKLHMMKESVQSMSLRDRRHCAEQVVSAFWRAIDGDEDELEN